MEKKSKAKAEQAKPGTTTVKTIQAHEAGPPHSIAPEVRALRRGKTPAEVFPEDDPRKEELYALLAIVIERAWTAIEPQLEDPATQETRWLFDPLSEQFRPHPRAEAERMLDGRRALFQAVDRLFEHYRALFMKVLMEQTENLETSSDPVLKRLQHLIDQHVHAVLNAKNIVREVMAGVETAYQVIKFVIAYVPEVYFLQFQRLPTPEEWLTILRNTEPFLLAVASKELSRFSAMNRILEQPQGDLHRYSGFWNEYRFRIEGEGKAACLALDGESLKTLKDDEAKTAPGEPPRIGCPALYAKTAGKNVIQALYRGLLQDTQAYLVPRYQKLTQTIIARVP